MPLFKLDPDQIVFVSEVVNGPVVKPNQIAANSIYFAAASGEKNYKLTVLDNSLVDYFSNLKHNGINVTSSSNFPLSNNDLLLTADIKATDNVSIRYKIVNESGVLVNYGIALDSPKTGENILRIERNLGTGIYHVYIWLQIDNNNTSFAASTPLFFKIGPQSDVQPETHTVTFSVIGGNGALSATINGVGIANGDSVEEGKNILFTATPNSAYRVKGWKLNNIAVSGNTSNNYTLINLKAAATVQVEFEAIPVVDTVGAVGGGGRVAPLSFNVIFNSNGGSAINRQSVSSGSKAIKPANPTKDGYTFAGWFSNSALTSEYDFSKAVTGDITLYAKWNEVIIEEETPLTSFVGFAAFIQGFEDNTFRGDTLITKEQFIAILYRLKNTGGTPEADKKSPTFKDVMPMRWSYEAIEWAVKAEIIAPDTAGNFYPATPLTRAAMAVILVKADNLTEIAENIFNDLTNHPASDDILKAYKAGIFTGYPDGTFRPNGNSTRYEAVTALVRYLLAGEPEDQTWQDIKLSFSDIQSNNWAYKYVALAVNGL
ncbi:MAG: S-layer homology domain-containing protein [Firmicutes bacterium]|nr:S-layer homology domain-containing protein [Bacillota bacterium]